MFKAQRITQDKAFEKIKYYCNYQERCHKEVKEKLYTYGLYKAEVEQIISQLIEADLLNEERFAIQFAGGKFRMRQWGRNKISYTLKQKQISAYCLKSALKQIDEEDYLACLLKLTQKKWQMLKKDGAIEKHAKVYAFLLQKGYESVLIQRAIDQVKASN